MAASGSGTRSPRHRARRRRTGTTRHALGWRIALPGVLLVAGVLFATSAETSQGSDLRGGRRDQLAELIRRGNTEVAASERRAADLRRSVDEATRSRTRRVR